MTQDYHRVAVPKGPSAQPRPLDRRPDDERLAAIRRRGWIGLRPADFAFLVEQAAARLAGDPRR